MCFKNSKLFLTKWSDFRTSIRRL